MGVSGESVSILKHVEPILDLRALNQDKRNMLFCVSGSRRCATVRAGRPSPLLRAGLRLPVRWLLTVSYARSNRSPGGRIVETVGVPFYTRRIFLRSTDLFHGLIGFGYSVTYGCRCKN